jgi:hypothetical protein
MPRHKIVDRLWAAAYEVARQSWIVSKGNKQDAERWFKNNDRILTFSPLTILAMLQFAFWLWDRWHKNGIDEPSVVMGSEEMQWIGSDDE